MKQTKRLSYAPFTRTPTLPPRPKRRCAAVSLLLACKQCRVHS